MSRYESTPVFGAFLVLFGAVFTALFGASVLGSPSGLPLAFGIHAVLLVAAGGLLVLAGTATRLRDRVGPHRLLGAGYVAWGVSFAVSVLGDAGVGAELATTLSSALGYGTVAVLVVSVGLVAVGVAYAVYPTVFGLGADGYPTE